MTRDRGAYPGGMARQWIDNSGITALGVCDCGWRSQIETSAAAAWRRCEEHGRIEHGDSDRARRARIMAETRAHG